MPAWLRSRSTLLTALLSAAAGLAHQLPAQSSPRAAPRGTFVYNVTGVFQGEPMEPWASRWTVADSTSPAGRLVIVEHRSRRAGNDFLFTDRAVMSPAGELVHVSPVGRGRMPTTYELSADSIATPAVPAFALGVALAAQELEAGATVRIGVLPLAAGSGLTAVRSFTGTVREDSLARVFGSPAEPVWVIVGDASYPAEAWIARADRQPLKLVLPQGTVGTMIEEYAGRAAP